MTWSGLVLSGAVIERFILVGCAGVSPATRRTLRTNLRALARSIERYPRAGSGAAGARAREGAVLAGGDRRVSAARRRAEHPSARRMRAGALVCFGAGAGIIAGELRHVRGSDVVVRAGGVMVDGRGRARALGAGP